MPNEDHHSAPTPDDPPRRYLVPGALIALAIVGVALLVLARDDDPAATSPPANSTTITASTATTMPDAKNEVVARLREILQVREEAFSNRDASLFDGIYTSDCPCLRAGREAIAGLKNENIRWQGRSISIEVQAVKRISKRLWEVTALFISDSFRIETEKGELVREVPSERLRYRFLLVRSSDSEPWRLGKVSPIEGE
jgi:hypothetical protein